MTKHAIYFICHILIYTSYSVIIKIRTSYIIDMYNKNSYRFLIPYMSNEMRLIVEEV